MENEIKNLVSKHGEFKLEIAKLQDGIQDVERNILQILVEDQAYEMFSINWPRLRKMLDRMARHN